MATTDDGHSEPATTAGPTRAGAAPAESRDGRRPPHTDAIARLDDQAADADADPRLDNPRPGSRPCGARRRPWTAPGLTSPAPRASLAATRFPVRISTGGSRPNGRPQPRPSRRSRTCMRRGSPSVLSRAPRAETWLKSPPILTRPSPGSARRWPSWSRAWRRSAFPSPPFPRRPGKPSRNSPAGTRRGTSTVSWSASCPSAGGPAGRGQAPPGPARPRPGGAEPPLLRRRQRDRWHGDPPQRQPRQ